ncbi:MAG TPA: zinc-binding dehydrogenase [Frankiaceae bacterium]|nr:zinc-binding dehydrogenase [Frankiaceae bacterium]
MKAARFTESTKTLAVQDVPTPEPGPLEVRVQVHACGICLTDAHLLDGSMPGSLPEITPGHEAAGVIDSVGPEVTGWKPGDRVLLAGGRNCGHCAMCVRGRLEECLQFEIMGFAYDGAWAEYVVVPFFALTEVPESIPLEQACVLADAVATPYAALTERANVRPGESVGLWGIGGLGVHAVQIARMIGASPILAFDPLPEARDRALALGADFALDPTDDDVVAQVWRLTDDLGLNVAIDLVGANRVLAQGDMCLGRHGRLVMVGLSPEPVQLGMGALFGILNHSLLGHLGYQKPHLDELVRLVSTGRLDVSKSVSAVIPLDDIADGVKRLETKEGNPVRIVVNPRQ